MWTASCPTSLGFNPQTVSQPANLPTEKRKEKVTYPRGEEREEERIPTSKRERERESLTWREKEKKILLCGDELE